MSQDPKPAPTTSQASLPCRLALVRRSALPARHQLHVGCLIARALAWPSLHILHARGCALYAASNGSDLFFSPLRHRRVQIMSFAAKVTALRRFLGVPETLEMLAAMEATDEVAAQTAQAAEYEMPPPGTIRATPPHPAFSRTPSPS